MDSDLDREALAVTLAGALGRFLDGHGGVGRPPRRVLGRIETEGRSDAARAHLLDAAAEGPHLVHQHLQRAARVRQPGVGAGPDQQGAHQGDTPVLPADGGGRGHRSGCRGRGPSRRLRHAVRPGTSDRRRDAGAQSQALDPRAERVARDAEQSRRARDVPPRLRERGQEVFPHRVVEGDGGGPRGRRPDLGGLGEPEHLRRDHRRLRQERHALDHVEQLADVARPGIGLQARVGARGQGLLGQAVVGARARQEALGEEHDIPLSLTERGQAESEHGQAVVEILAEAPVLDGRLQVGVGGADDPGIDGLGGGGAEAAHGPLLDDLEELGLQRLGEEPHLVEEDGAVVGRLEEPGLRAAGIGEGAALETEQLGLEERLGNGRAVHVHEGPGVAGAAAVDEPGHQPFPGAGLALDQDGRKAARARLPGEKPADVVLDRLEGGALADQFAQDIHLRRPEHEEGGFALHPN